MSKVGTLTAFLKGMHVTTICESLAAYLSRIPTVTRVETSFITIRGEQYPAARYTERLQHTPGTPAYARGEREYTREMIYCVGMLPAVRRNGNVAFRMPGDSRDWYVASYYGNVKNRKQETAEPDEYHPHGNMFLLAPWDIDGATIDQYERVPYKRAEVAIARTGWTLRAWERVDA